MMELKEHTIFGVKIVDKDATTISSELSSSMMTIRNCHRRHGDARLNCRR